MDSSRDSEFDQRLARIEAAIIDLQGSMAALLAEREIPNSWERAAAPPPGEQRRSSYYAPTPLIAPGRRQDKADQVGAEVSSWFASHDAEWWLSRVGIGFVILAVLLLYGYAVDKGWITPPIRVLTGVTVGAVLFWIAARIRARKDSAAETSFGFREVLLGGALAIWFVTAYAAAVWYRLIPMPAARLVFVLLAILSTWFALDEDRKIFALLAVATGFATPFILPAPVQSMTELSLYLGAVTGIGLIIYLLRGWQSILWITFLAFWVSVAQTATAQGTAHPIQLDSFDSVSHWTAAPSAGVEVTIHSDSGGTHGRAMRLDFDFHGHGGYAVVHRVFDATPILPANYEFSFAIRGDAPTNTLEFKLVDTTGRNVWWSQNQNFQFPLDWQTINRTKRQLRFAWGPTTDYELKRLGAIEFAITAGSGGKGSVWLDDLALRPLPVSSVATVEPGPIMYVQPPLRRIRSAATGSLALTILLLAAAVAFTRVPLLRRRLLELGSPRYTAAPVTSEGKRFVELMDALSAPLGGGKSAVDSLVVWALVLATPVFTIGFLGAIWPQVTDEVSGILFVVLALGALAFSRRPPARDAEIPHVALTAATLWGLIGVNLLLPTPEQLAGCAVLAAFVIDSVTRKFAGPRAFAKLTIGLALLTIAAYELASDDTGLVHLRLVVSGIVTVGASAFIASSLIAEPVEEIQGTVLAAATYLTGLIVVWSALNPLWAPLVTTSYAVLGALLLIMSRREGAHALLKYLGGLTMIVVVGRLLFVDLSTVETIWRVLLFLVCGAVFLYTGYRMQPPRVKKA